MNIKVIYVQLLNMISNVAGIDAAKKFDTKLRFHRNLNLKNPQTLADKVSYIELHEQSELASICTDKWAVREYIEQKELSEILVPVVGGVWNSVSEVEFDQLPESYVLKATHGCKMNYLVPCKEKLDKEKCVKELQRWLDTTYGIYSMEPHYKKIPHQIYAEQYLGDMNGLIDYKFHCLNGKPQFVLTVSERRTEGDKPMRAIIDLFDMEWNWIPEVVQSNFEKPGKGLVKKPEHLEEMMEIAKTLSEDFKFVRVDLYEWDNKVYFGELTFSPACCVFPYFTEKFNAEMGKVLVI
jgi:hypothetical protein